MFYFNLKGPAQALLLLCVGKAKNILLKKINVKLPIHKYM
jgi:hypothetical protein